jgi:hypothetical protein
LIKTKPKAPWNSYLTDGEQYKLTKEKVIEKKRLYVSKNNMLISQNRESLVNRLIDNHVTNNSEPNTLLKAKSFQPKKIEKIYENKYVTHEELNSLDLIETPIEFHNPKTENVDHNQIIINKKNISTRNYINMNNSLPKNNYIKNRIKMNETQCLENKHAAKNNMTNQDTIDIITSIKSLQSELIHFEQLSGKRSALIDPEVTYIFIYNIYIYIYIKITF